MESDFQKFLKIAHDFLGMIIHDMTIIMPNVCFI